jgi:hypothetical protein
MIQTQCKTWLGVAIICAAVTFSSCKSKEKENTNVQSTDTVTTTTTPPQVSQDEVLTKGVADATKDYPGVTATVNNGEVTLTGTIRRDKLPALMQSIQGLSPRKVNNNLTIK